MPIKFVLLLFAIKNASMLRIKTVPTSKQLTISIPEKLVGKEIEIIAFSASEISEENPVVEKVLTHVASEKSLAKDWATDDEDKAWSSL